ncbi:hypothetical protein E8E13_001283 [Curvularia kusanoi]|uniref:Uncharacterized protein n=1 Tax=Curvularia kusanoi TaxID=90978 RepID=A0A9P4W4M3_CURKU|nr:hypothetical protein E8E13_001283 [Curvularia kusanoi]
MATTQQLEQAYEKYRYEALFGAWLVVTGATFMRIKRQPYSMRLKVEQYESIFKGTSLGAIVLGIGMSPKRGMRRVAAVDGHLTVSRRCRDHWRDRLGIPTPSHVTGQASSFFHHPGGVHGNSRISKMLFRLGKVSIELNPWNPLYAVAPFVIVMVSVPLAIFAVVTTSVALSLLAFRGFIVYAQLGTALLSAWLSPTAPKPVPLHHQLTPPDRSPPTRSRNRRRSSNGSGTSSQDTSMPAPRLGTKSGSFTALLGEGGPTRDYEGVGGWRDTGNDDEEALWMGINSRLQLPAEIPGRRHQRRHTGGHSRSPEAYRMSPVQSRARTPIRVATSEGHDIADYFPRQQASSDRVISAPDPLKRHSRRLSGSGSSVMSVASTMTPVKEAGE